MTRKLALIAAMILLLLTGVPRHAAAQSSSVSPSDLILAMNTLRVSNGYPALIVDPVVMSVAQATADIMAANNMSWHIGDVRGRIAAAGYGSGSTVWATENFAVGFTMGIDEIMLAWADPDHMRPATNAAYCHVGAGVSQAADGRIYYILQAAYTSEDPCGPNTYPGGGTSGGGSSSPPVSQIIIPVQIAAPDVDGKIYHVVKSGQSLWAIAVAYRITIADIEFWNNISRANPLYVGQRLFIPSSSTAGYATPTPVGMVVRAAPDQDGKIVHVVQPYQTLITIADAYEVPVNTVLALNGWQQDWPLQIDQKLLISPGDVTPSPTPRPLTPLEMLTPAADGRYYHTVQSGETLSYIAGLYEVSLADLMAWNGLTSSIIVPDQDLLLQVTPPATITPTPGPPTETPTASPSPTASATLPPPTATATPAEERPAPEVEGPSLPLVIGVALAMIGGGLLVVVLMRREREE